MLKEKVITSFNWSFSIKALSSILQLLTLTVLGRLLTPEDFGTMGVLLVIVGFSKIVSEFGLGAAIIQKKDITKEDQQTVLVISLSLAAIFAIAMVLFSKNISLFFNNPAIEIPMRVMSTVFIIDSAVVIQIALAQKYMNFKFISIVFLVSYLFGNCMITILFAYLGFGVWSLVYGYIASSLITFVAFIVKYGFIIPRWASKDINALFSFGSYFTIGRLANYFANKGDYFIIGKFLGAGLLGYYSRAYQIVAAPAEFFGGTLQRILFPAFSEIQTNKDSIKGHFLFANRILAYPSLLVFAIVLFWGQQLTSLILGPGWDQTVTPLKILSAGLVFKMGYKTTTPILNAIGLVKRQTLVEIIYFIVVICCVLVGSFYGINGVSYGVTLSIFIIFIISAYFCSRALNVRPIEILKQYLNPAISAFLVWISFVILNYSTLYFLLFGFLLLMLLWTFYRKGYFNGEISLIKSLLSRSK